eukprot:CAMPEP_0196725454 /NCGR_PEP_ID=MMETSP1091-20130531/7030_1 /TAXON_ID=302021 /ORGANISM="Rhodomonas sp., Strain CCMP768" /LENGTH=92 /DNA_ID=CAMNT_0042067745 /DNA_START=38 /DNA_END=316 /DNA_ORIENTATION=-
MNSFPSTPSSSSSPTTLAFRRSGGPPALWFGERDAVEMDTGVDSQAEFEELLNFDAAPTVSTRAQDMARRVASSSGLPLLGPDNSQPDVDMS